MEIDLKELKNFVPRKIVGGIIIILLILNFVSNITPTDNMWLNIVLYVGTVVVCGFLGLASIWAHYRLELKDPSPEAPVANSEATVK